MLLSAENSAGSVFKAEIGFQESWQDWWPLWQLNPALFFW